MPFWIVNSYGYPNPFVDNPKSKSAWEIFMSFVNNRDYESLKSYWTSNQAPRKMENSSALESWKTTFEEFGLLYVISRSNEIIITPAGNQIIEAVQKNDHRTFLWCGLTLLLRYPLRGAPRARPKGSNEQRNSDILPYWFLLAAMKELGGYYWRFELDFVLSRVFTVSDANEAIEKIKLVRGGSLPLSHFVTDALHSSNSFYNMMNQICVHSSMYYDLIDKSSSVEFDTTGYSQNFRFSFKSEWSHMIDKALGGVTTNIECMDSVNYITRMPRYNGGVSEREYFEYLGREVASFSNKETAIYSIDMASNSIALLQEGIHFTLADSSRIFGSINQLCKVSINQRIIINIDKEWTYLVKEKQIRSDGLIDLIIKKSIPISNYSLVQERFELYDTKGKT